MSKKDNRCDALDCCRGLFAVVVGMSAAASRVGRRSDQSGIFNGTDRKRGAERQTNFARLGDRRDDVNAKGGVWDVL